MTTRIASELARAAQEEADAGHPWPALTAHLAADAVVAGRVLSNHPRAVVDVANLQAGQLGSTVLESLSLHRKLLLEGVSTPEARDEIRESFHAAAHADLTLDPSVATAFRHDWLAGREPASALEAEESKAGRFHTFALRLIAIGDTGAAERAVRVGDTSQFYAHHLRACLDLQDTSLALLHAAALLATRHLRQLPAEAHAAAAREALDSATLTEAPVPWKPVAGLLP